MMKLALPTVAALTLSQAALSEPNSDATTAQVAEKCTAAAEAAGFNNAQEGCECFANSLSDEERDAYMAMDLTEWDNSATDDMKEKGFTCFPETRPPE